MLQELLTQGLLPDSLPYLRDRGSGRTERSLRLFFLLEALIGAAQGTLNLPECGKRVANETKAGGLYQRGYEANCRPST